MAGTRKGQIDELKRSAQAPIKELEEIAAKMKELNPVRSDNLLKLTLKLKEWQNR